MWRSGASGGYTQRRITRFYEGSAISITVRTGWTAWLSLLVLWIAPATGAVADTLWLDDDSERLDPTEYVWYLAEGDQVLSLDRVTAGDLAGAWRPVPGEINFGYREDFIWYRLVVANPEPFSLRRYLEVSYALLDDVEFLQVHQGEIISDALTGDALPHSSRPLAHRTFVFPFELPPGEEHELYLRIGTSGSHQVPMAIWNPAAFEVANSRDMMIRGALYGMLFIMGLFTLLLFVAIRERSLLFISGVQFVLLVAMSSLHGTFFQYFIPNLPRLHELLILITVPLSTFFFAIFSIEFLRVRRRAPGVCRLLAACAVASLLAAIGGMFLPYALSTRISVSVVAIGCVVIMASGLILAWRGQRDAKLFVFAWFALLGGTVGHILSLSGALPTALNMGFAMETGSVLASLVLSFALGERFHKEQQERLDLQRAREEAERAMLASARRHHLTGLPNRVALEESLYQMVGAGPQSVQRLALVVIHLQDFKDINNTLGHEQADEVLVRLAERLNLQVMSLPDHIPLENADGEACGLAHIEGVTFACLFEQANTSTLTGLMQILIRNLQQPITYREMRLTVSALAGCALYPDDSQDVPTLLRQAFIAYGRAARQPDNTALYVEEGSEYTERRLRLVTDLSEAIRNDQLELYFQPQIRLDNNTLYGFEALLRWQHPEFGWIRPDEAVALAEKTGLIQMLTDWVFRQVLSFLARMEEAGHLVSCSINISSLNLLDPDLVARFQRMLQRSALEPHRVVLELTETAAMADPEVSLKVLQALNDAGMRLAIDDFGTGHSSLSYIRRLPVHEIKIDKSFVMEMDRTHDDATIVETTVRMCHDLGYMVVAEGVESPATLAMLTAMGCDVAQGYGILRPSPVDEIMRWVQQHSQ